jgi:hypothetical protein
MNAVERRMEIGGRVRRVRGKRAGVALPCRQRLPRTALLFPQLELIGTRTTETVPVRRFETPVAFAPAGL